MREEYPRVSRTLERAADLFTVRVPELAQGLINRLRRSLIGRPPEVQHPSDTHPPTLERIEYLNQALLNPLADN